MVTCYCHDINVGFWFNIFVYKKTLFWKTISIIFYLPTCFRFRDVEAFLQDKRTQ